MKFTTTTLTGLVLAGLATAVGGAPAGTGIELRFERSADLAQSIEHRESHSLEMDRLAMTRGDGEPIVSEVSMHIWTTSSARATEEVDARTGHLRRQYGPIEGALQIGRVEGEQEARGPEMPLDSRLSEVGVAYVPRAGAPDGHARHYDTVKSLEEEILPGLAVPRDWGRLLPRDAAGAARAVEPGEAWTVDAKDLEVLFAPVGDTVLMGVKGTDPRMMRSYEIGLGGNLHAGFAGNVAGEASARIVEEGASGEFGRYVDIRVEFLVTLAADRTESARQDRPGRETEEFGVDTVGAGLEQTFEGASVVRWSLDSNGPLRFTTEAKESTRVSVSLREGAEVVEQVVDMSGDVRLTTSFSTAARIGSARAR